jgi:hypothetical protein
MIPLKIDMNSVNFGTRTEDEEIGNALEPYIPQIADALWQCCQDRKLLIFAPLCKIAQKIQDAMAKAGRIDLTFHTADPCEAGRQFTSTVTGSSTSLLTSEKKALLTEAIARVADEMHRRKSGPKSGPVSDPVSCPKPSLAPRASTGSGTRTSLSTRSRDDLLARLRSRRLWPVVRPSSGLLPGLAPAPISPSGAPSSPSTCASCCIS